MKKLMLTLLGASFANALYAQEPSGLAVKGVPVDGALGFQPAATELARDYIALDNLLLYVVVAISVFVTGLLIYVVVKFNRKANPTPATFTHNTVFETAWTLIPCVILLVIAVPSLQLLRKQMIIPEADVTIKATGLQWYWTHEYVDHGFEFDSVMLQKEELGDYGYDESLYLLATDTSVVIPTGKNIVIQVTGSDVIHAWTIPAFGVKQDAVPGRLAELWFKVDEGKEGIYFGQCSELCGKNHAYMPITVKAVSPSEYEAWLDGAIEEYAGIPRDVKLASSD